MLCNSSVHYDSLCSLLEVSSRPWDRTRRSCVIRIVTVDSAGFSGHGVSTTVDTSDQMLLTPECTCLRGATVQCDEGTCWLTYSAWTGYVVVPEASGGRCKYDRSATCQDVVRQQVHNKSVWCSLGYTIDTSRPPCWDIPKSIRSNVTHLASELWLW